MGWRDIKTAPTDGTKVLLGRFAEGQKHHGLMSVDWYRTARARAGFIGFGHFNEQFWPPTHWQPLPKPPTPTESERHKGDA